MKLYTYTLTAVLGCMVIFGMTAAPVSMVHADEISEDDSMQSMTAEQLQKIIDKMMKDLEALQKKNGKSVVKKKVQEIVETKKIEDEMEHEVETESLHHRLSILSDLKEGMSGDEVRRLQKILASDPAIYPEGLQTGFFGPLTAKALTRFQEKHGLKVEGVLSVETRDFINSILTSEGEMTDISSELLRMWEVKKQARMLEETLLQLRGVDKQ